jgi:hypothetical protein
MATLLDKLRTLSAVDCDTLDAEGKHLSSNLTAQAANLHQ